MAKKRTKGGQMVRDLSKPKNVVGVFKPTKKLAQQADERAVYPLFAYDILHVLADHKKLADRLDERLAHLEFELSQLDSIVTLKEHLAVQCAAVRRLTREKELLLEDRHERDAIDDHPPNDWSTCDHESFHDIATRGDDPIWFCEDCQTIVDEDEIDG